MVGQDQVLDVELDKNTILLPSQHEYLSIDSKLLWNSSLSFDRAAGQSGNPDDANLIQPNLAPALIPSSDDTTTVDDNKLSALSKIVDQFPLVRSGELLQFPFPETLLQNLHPIQQIF